MASKVEGELGLKITGFQAALKNAGKLMSEFGEHAKETAAQAGEQLRDIAKETGTSKIGNLVGLAGGAAVVTTFMAAAVETIKKGSEASEEFETHAMQMGNLLGDMPGGKALEEWIHHARAGTSSVEDLESAVKHLIEAGLNVDQAKEKLLQFQKVALATGEPVDALVTKYQQAIAGGLDAGEGAARLLKSGPMLMLATEEKKKGEGEKRQKAQGKLQLDTLYHGINSPEVAKDKEALAEVDKEIKESVHDWVKAGNLTTKALDRILASVTGPGGKFEKADVESGETEAGKKAALAEAFDEEIRKVGDTLSTSLKPALDELTAALPKMTVLFDSLGIAAKGAIDVLVSMGGMVKNSIDSAQEGGAKGVAYDYDLRHGKGAYSALLADPGKPGQLMPGDKGFSKLDALPDHAQKQTETLIRISDLLYNWFTGG